MVVFYGNEPCLDITICSSKGPNFNKKYGLHRDRLPDAGWGELRSSLLSGAKVVAETPELRQLLLEDLAFAYGRDTKKFAEKLTEFKFI